MVDDILTFDAAEHSYRLRGVPVPSVTQVLKATGYIRLDGIPAPVLEAARDRGQRVHQALHFLFEDDLDESTVDEDIAGYLASARAYIAQHVQDVLLVEQRLYSERHAYAGTVDLVAVQRDGLVSVTDFKTGDPSDVAADLQTAAYLGCLLELPSAARHGWPHGPLQRRSVRLFRDGRIARETPYTDHLDYTRFLNALSVVHDQARRPAPTAWDDER